MGVLSKVAKLAKKATEKARLKAAQAAARETARIKQKEQSLVKTVDTRPTEVVLGKKASNENKSKEKQTSRERQVNAIGKISGALTKPGNKPLSMAMYRSMSDAQLDKQVKVARSGYKNGNLTKAVLDEILDKVKRSRLANERNPGRISRAMEQGKRDSKMNKKSKVSLKENTIDYSRGGMAKPNKGMEALKKAAPAVAKKMGYNKGGYVNCGASVPGTQRKK